MNVAVVGGGIIGLAIAWRCATRGHTVTVYDPDPGAAATTVAAGMLAPVAESRFGEEPLHALLLAAAARWPGFAAELTAATGLPLGFQLDGTLLVAMTDDDLRVVRRLVDFHRRAGLAVEPLDAAALREREPLLSPRVRGGAYVPADGQVDPRRVTQALRQAATAAGVTFIEDRPTESTAGSTVDVTVLAAGHGTAALVPGLPIRPVKGQILRLFTPEPLLHHVIRGFVGNRSVYLVPRADGEVVVGATEEERGTDTTVTAGGVLDLLRPAVALVPDLAEYVLVECRAGLRPGTPDNAPVVGRLDRTTLVATGHYRDGILLAPSTADAIADLVDTGTLPALFEPFQPNRFAGVST